ncbi:MAG: hypothetical protein HGA82_01705 [Anaerolineales bacterium]|nr:hypothetical protein [Anaerolineales bacterium]
MKTFANELVDKFSVKTPGLDTPIKNLSGGNIQKLIMARELSRQPKVLIASQPTRGVDIGATEYIHQRLLQQREQGTAILLISDDLDEIRSELTDCYGPLPQTADNLLRVIGILYLSGSNVTDEIIPAWVMLCVALPFLVAWLINRKRRWALIPAFVMFVLAAITLLSSFAAGEWIGALVMYAIALPFLVIWFLDRKKRWALIPAGIMAILGTIQLLASYTRGDLSGLVVMFLFSTPFFVLYFWSKHNWWALIPAGVFASIGLVVLLSLIFHGNQDLLNRIGSGVLFLGFAATFGVLWLRRSTQPTDWAKYPAAGLLAAAVLAFALGERFQDYWPATILLVAGVLLLLNTLVKRKPEDKGSTPTDNP